ncbi:MAG: hypothetical protein LBV36_02875, partial [Chromatiales bacterium]|nr:hypothetical protein [Chromatiales bacterium]
DFGLEGIVSTDIAGFDTAYDLAVQADGKIVVAGEAGRAAHVFALARYLDDGTPDASFGDGGVVATDFGFDASATALALQADGRIVVAGYARADSGGSARCHYVIARYDDSGALDERFGAGGVAVLDLGDRGGCDHVALALQSDGRIVIAVGFMAQDARNADMIVARLATDGRLDSEFNAGGEQPGMVIADFGGDDHAYAVLVQFDGRIVAAGQTRDGKTQSAALVRYLPDGQLDTGFGGSARGLVAVKLDGYECSSAQALVQLPDARIVFTGAAEERCGENAHQFLLYSLTPNGLEDKATVAGVSAGDGVAYAIAVQPDYRVLLTGVAASGGDTQVAMARFFCGSEQDAPWNLLPYEANFANVNGAPRGELATTEFVAVQGFDSNIIVPIRVFDGEYALNGSSEYTTAPGWVQLGDEVSVRHINSTELQGVVTTRVVMGGVRPANNLTLFLGPNAELSFTSTSSASGTGAGAGSGALDTFALATLLCAAFIIGTRRGR